MFSEELKKEFLERIETILDNDDLSNYDKKSVIGKLFIDFEKRNKSIISNNIICPIKQKRNPTTYNIFIKEKMKELKEDVIQSKFRFKKASNLWKK